MDLAEIMWLTEGSRPLQLGHAEVITEKRVIFTLLIFSSYSFLAQLLCST